jgi:predicted DCC family thiol-disulfide oxidoreductase YuxK
MAIAGYTTEKADAGKHLLLYDGVCGLCNRAIRFVLRRDSRALFDFAPLQSETGRTFLARAGLNPQRLDTVYVIADYRTGAARALSKSRAALFVLQALGGVWRIAGALRALPAPLLDRGYDLIARRRYAMFGRYDTCPLPAPEHRRRFLD